MYTADNAQMAKFKSKLKQLMLVKSVELGYTLTQSELAERTGLSMPAIGRWYNNNITSLELATVKKLTDYFGCEMSDLVEYIKEDD